MKQLKGKRALVTGAAGGIGRAISLRLAEEGVKVAMADCNPFGLESVRRELDSQGFDSQTFVCDVTQPNEIQSVTDKLIDQWAGVDILVNNAGITYHGVTHTMPAEEWDRMLAVNLNSHLQFTHQLLPSMLARPNAHIVNVCSMLGLSGMPRVTAYCTTKFAMVGFSESLRAEYGRVGLGVTALCPGFVDTGLFGAAKPEAEGRAPKAPPKWMCITPERVANRSIRAIKRNEHRVTLDPAGGILYHTKRWMPGLFDFLLSLGKSKRIAKKEKELQSLSEDQDQAIRMKLGLVEADQSPTEVYQPLPKRAA